MRNCLVIMLSVVVLSGTALAQDYDYGKYKTPQEYRSTTKFGLGSILWGHLLLSSEYKVLHDFTSGPYASTQIGASFLTSGLLLMSSNSTAPGQDKLILRGYRVQATQKFYLDKQKYAPEGFYIGPHVSLAEGFISTKDLLKKGVYFRFTQFNVCGVLGYQMIMDGFVMDMYTGIGYKNNSISNTIGSTAAAQLNGAYQDMPFYRGNVRFMLGLNLGFANRAK